MSTIHRDAMIVRHPMSYAVAGTGGLVVGVMRLCLVLAWLTIKWTVIVGWVATIWWPVMLVTYVARKRVTSRAAASTYRV